MNMGRSTVTLRNKASCSLPLEMSFLWVRNFLSYLRRSVVQNRRTVYTAKSDNPSTYSPSKRRHYSEISEKKEDPTSSLPTGSIGNNTQSEGYACQCLVIGIGE